MANPNFNRVFSATGINDSISDADYSGGWEDIAGETPPEKSEFNSISNEQDRKLSFLNTSKPQTWSDSGLVNTYIADVDGSVSFDLFDGFSMMFRPALANTGNSTIDGPWTDGVKSIRNKAGAQIGQNELSGIVDLAYDAENGWFVLKSSSGVANGKNSNGYYRFHSDGYLEQWGRGETTDSATVPMVQEFPIPFDENKGINVQVTNRGNVIYSRGNELYAHTETSESVIVERGGIDNNRYISPYAWSAIGYAEGGAPGPSPSTIAFEGSSIFASSSSQNTHTWQSIEESRTAGLIILCCVLLSDGVITSIDLSGSPKPWTAISPVVNNNLCSLRWFYRISDGTDVVTNSASLNTSAWSHITEMVYSGQNVASPIFDYATDQGDSPAFLAPSVSGADAQDYVIRGFSSDSSNVITCTGATLREERFGGGRGSWFGDQTGISGDTGTLDASTVQSGEKWISSTVILKNA